MIGSFYLNFFTVQHSVLSVLERKPVAKDVPQAERATCKNSVETDSVEKKSDRMREIFRSQNDSTRKVQAVYLATPPRSWMGLG